MKGTIAATAIAAMLTASPAAAIYKCLVEGETVFSQTPCAPDAQPVAVKIHRPSDDEARRAAERAEWTERQSATLRSERKGRAAAIEIESLERQINVYQQDMEKELSSLREKKASANNNLAGATWEQAQAVEMQAVVDRYNTKIEIARSKIAVLREQVPAP